MVNKDLKREVTKKHSTKHCKKAEGRQALPLGRLLTLPLHGIAANISFPINR